MNTKEALAAVVVTSLVIWRVVNTVKMCTDLYDRHQAMKGYAARAAHFYK